MSRSTASHIDFDEWSQLAAADPPAFEARRAELLEAWIRRSADHRQPRLRRLQWRIDQVRRLSKSPLGACIKINDLMLEALLGEGGLLEQMDTLRGPRPLPRSARVIPIHPRAPR